MKDKDMAPIRLVTALSPEEHVAELESRVKELEAELLVMEKAFIEEEERAEGLETDLANAPEQEWAALVSRNVGSLLEEMRHMRDRMKYRKEQITQSEFLSLLEEGLQELGEIEI
jgi:hypothetical protein